MKRKARERTPKRTAGSFPSYLYKSLDELEGAWGEPTCDSSLVVRSHALRRKPLIILSDEELDLALGQQIGMPWLRMMVLIRLRENSMRTGDLWSRGDLLRTALRLPKAAWGNLLADLEQIADTVVPTLDREDEAFDRVAQAYRSFKESA